jgi:hypothetical protein
MRPCAIGMQPPYINTPLFSLAFILSTFPCRCCKCLGVSAIPGLLALTDCVMGLASGMTIKFFPIFFKDEVRYISVRTALSSYACQWALKVLIIPE